MFGTGTEDGHHYNLGFAAHTPAPGTTSRRYVPLLSPDRGLSFLLLPIVEYRVDVATNRRITRISVAGYSYRLLAADLDELLAFHWHPMGMSRFTRPHVHVSGAASIALPAHSGDLPRSLDIGKAHLPTPSIEPEDLVELLIADPVFAVAPRRADWRQVLAANRAAADHSDVD